MLSLNRANAFIKVNKWRPGKEWVSQNSSHWPRAPPIENGSTEASGCQQSTAKVSTLTLGQHLIPQDWVKGVS